MSAVAWRRRAATLLAGVGLVLLFLSLQMVYVGRVLLRSDTFADRVSQSLSDPRVGELLALRITDAIIEQQPDLTALRPILVVVTRGVVTSVPFRALVRPAVRQTHDALRSGTTEDILLALPDAQVLIQEALRTVGPAATERLPERLRPLLLARGAGAGVQVARQFLGIGDMLRPFGRLGIVIAVLCLAAAILITPARRSALVSSGVGIATVGALLALTVTAGRIIPEAALGNSVTGAAAAALWAAFFGPLRTIGAVVAVIGIVTALIGIPGNAIEPAAVRNKVQAFIFGRRERPWEEATRLFALTVVGLVIALFPSTALELAAITAGTALVVLSLAGVRRLVQADLPATLVGVQEEIRVGSAALAAVRIVVLLAIGVGAAAVVLRLRPKTAEVVAVHGEECNGAVELCARPLNRVVFAGAHNAMGSATNPTWLFPNQNIDIRSLLDRGVRAFLLDPYRGNRMGDAVRTDFDAVPHANRKIAEVIGQAAWDAGMRIRERLTGDPGKSDIYLCHGFCELGAIPMIPALHTFVEFLVTHPDEVIIIDFEDYAPPADIVTAFEESGLIDFVYRGPLGPTWPTLGEMVESGGRVVVIGENDVDDVPWYHLAWDGLMAETPYTFPTREDFSCRPNRGSPTAPLFLMNHWIETTPTPRPSNAQIVNQRDVIVQRARQCQRERGMTPNIIAVDFAGIGDVVGAARELNELSPLP
jgi:hypothetical protein